MGQRDSERMARRPSSQAAREQRIADTAVELSYAIVRSEDFSEHLVTQVYRLFSADAGVGITTWRPTICADPDQLTVVVAGCDPLSKEQSVEASRFASTHPGLVAMSHVGTTSAVRVSDHTDLAKYWTTESYWRMHGHTNGRYPAAALLLVDREVQIFIGMHRRDRDFSDADMAGLAALQRPIAAALAFRSALDDTVRLLQTSGIHRDKIGPLTVDRRRSLASAVRLCRDYAPTRREGEVLALAAEGWTNHQIGRRLGITERTVRKHLTAVYDKAGVRGRAAWWQRLND